MKKEVYEVVLTFNISINREGVVAFVMPTQDKHSSYTKCRTYQPTGLLTHQ